MNATTDAELVVAAAGGDDSAFAGLYERYFDRVYDFVRRMVRDGDDAADVAQDAFVKAMGGIGKLKDPSSFKTWIFSIARNTALNRIEQSGRVVHDKEDEEGDSLLYRQVDTNALDNPEQAADANELAALVWEAASSLDPKQYAVLDLTVRQEMSSAEIAGVLKVSKGNAYTMVSRVKDAMEEAVTALFMTRQGSKDCPTLEALVEQMTGGALSADSRRLVMKHVKSCEICEERRKKVVSPVALFGAFAPFPAAAEVKASIRGASEEAWRGSLAGGGAGAGGSGLVGSFTTVQLALGALAALTILAVSGFLAALSLGDSNGDEETNVAAVSATEEATEEEEEDDEEDDATATATATATPSPTPTATATAPAGVLPPAGPGNGNGPPPPPGPQLAPPQLAIDFNSIQFDGPGAVTLHLSNQGGQELDWSISGVPGWLQVSPGGGNLPAGGSADLLIAVPEGTAPGDYAATLAIGSGGGNLNVEVTASIAAPPDNAPPQLQGRVSCAFGQQGWVATGAAQASDASGIESVRMTVDSFGSTAMTLSGANYSATLFRQTTPPATVGWSITAVDGAGNETTISGSDSCV